MEDFVTKHRVGRSVFSDSLQQCVREFSGSFWRKRRKSSDYSSFIHFDKSLFLGLMERITLWILNIKPRALEHKICMGKGQAESCWVGQTQEGKALRFAGVVSKEPGRRKHKLLEGRRPEGTTGRPLEEQQLCTGCLYSQRPTWDCGEGIMAQTQIRIFKVQ